MVTQANEKYRVQLFYAMSGVGLCCLAAFGVRAALQHEMVTATLEIAAFFLTIANIFLFFTTGNFIWSCRFLTLLLCIVLIILGHVEATHNGISLWYYTFPLLTIFLTGAFEGALWSAGVLVIAGIFILRQFFPGHGAVFSGLLISRFIAVYCAITSMSIAFERIRSKAQGNLDLSEDALIKKNEELRMLLSSISDVVFSIDLNGNLMRIFKPFDGCAFIDLPSEFIGHPFKSVLPPQVSQGLQTAVERLCTTEEIQEFPYEIGEGEQKAWFFAKVSKMKNAAGAVYGHTVVARNITQQHLEEQKRKVLEEELQRSESQALMGRITAGVAHEINNPASAITSDIATMLYLMGQAPDTAIKSSITDILHRDRAAISRITNIVCAVKGAYRPQQWHSIDLANEIELQLALVRKECKDRIEIRREFAVASKVEVCGSEIGQILLNLLTNAIDSIEGSGIITLRTSETDTLVLISVIDTGKGIVPGNLPHIFDPFFTTKEIGKGTGLGLSISLSHAKRHGGKLFVEKSIVGEGTTLTLEIPKKRIQYEKI